MHPFIYPSPNDALGQHFTAIDRDLFKQLADAVGNVVLMSRAETTTEIGPEERVLYGAMCDVASHSFGSNWEQRQFSARDVASNGSLFCECLRQVVFPALVAWKPLQYVLFIFDKPLDEKLVLGTFVASVSAAFGLPGYHNVTSGLSQDGTPKLRSLGNLLVDKWTSMSAGDPSISILIADRAADEFATIQARNLGIKDKVTEMKNAEVKVNLSSWGSDFVMMAEYYANAFKEVFMFIHAMEAMTNRGSGSPDTTPIDRVAFEDRFHLINILTTLWLQPYTSLTSDLRGGERKMFQSSEEFSHGGDQSTRKQFMILAYMTLRMIEFWSASGRNFSHRPAFANFGPFVLPKEGGFVRTLTEENGIIEASALSSYLLNYMIRKGSEWDAVLGFMGLLRAFTGFNLYGDNPSPLVIEFGFDLAPIADSIQVAEAVRKRESESDCRRGVGVEAFEAKEKGASSLEFVSGGRWTNDNVDGLKLMMFGQEGHMFDYTFEGIIAPWSKGFVSLGNVVVAAKPITSSSGRSSEVAKTFGFRKLELPPPSTSSDIFSSSASSSISTSNIDSSSAIMKSSAGSSVAQDLGNMNVDSTASLTSSSLSGSKHILDVSSDSDDSAEVEIEPMSKKSKSGKGKMGEDEEEVFFAAPISGVDNPFNFGGPSSSSAHNVPDLGNTSDSDSDSSSSDSDDSDSEDDSAELPVASAPRVFDINQFSIAPQGSGVVLAKGIIRTLSTTRPDLARALKEGMFAASGSGYKVGVPGDAKTQRSVDMEKGFYLLLQFTNPKVGDISKAADNVLKEHYNTTLSELSKGKFVLRTASGFERPYNLSVIILLPSPEAFASGKTEDQEAIFYFL